MLIALHKSAWRTGVLPGMALLCALLITQLGCSSGTKPYVSPNAPLRDHPGVAMLPLEDLAGREEIASKVTHIFFVELVRTGVCDVLEMGETERALKELRIRNTGSLTNDQIQGLGDRLEVGFLMTGTVLEAGTVRTDQGVVPALGVTLKLIDVAAKRVIWADVAHRSGDDQETVFGWGREHSAEQLAVETAQNMFKSLHELATPESDDNDGGES